MAKIKKWRLYNPSQIKSVRKVSVAKSTSNVNVMSRKEKRHFDTFLQKQNLTNTKRNLQKFKAYENKVAKINRTVKADKLISKVLKGSNIDEGLIKVIKRSAISYYKGAVGFTQKQFEKLQKDISKLNDLEMAKKVLPKIARANTSQMRFVKSLTSFRDVSNYLFVDDFDIYLKLRDLIIAYNENPDKLITDKSRGVKNMRIGEYLSLRWNENKSEKRQKERDELLELLKYK